MRVGKSTRYLRRIIDEPTKMVISSLVKKYLGFKNGLIIKSSERTNKTHDLIRYNLPLPVLAHSKLKFRD